MSALAEARSRPANPERVKVWDPFVRLFHWALVASFAGAFALGDDGGPGA